MKPSNARKFWVLVFSSIIMHVLFVFPVFGQGCDLLLRDGVFNTFNAGSGSYSYDQWHQAWCSGTLKQTSSGGSTGVSLDVVVKTIPIGLNFSDAQQFQSMYQSKFCGSADRTKVNLEQESTFQKTADPVLLSEYVQCRQVETKGLETHFTESPNHKVFVVTMRYNQPFEDANKPSVKTISFVPNSVSCTGTIKPPMKLDASSNSLQCERTVDTEVSVLINTDVGAFTRDLPAVTPPPTDQQKVMAAMPQGTIMGWAAKAPIPPGWHICDGQAGTVDLGGRVPYGTSDAAQVGTQDGKATHQHTVSGRTGAPLNGLNDNVTQRGGIVAAGNDHTHSLSGTTNEVSNLPPVTRIIFIQKLG